MSISLARPKLKAQILAGETPDWVLNHIRSQYLISCALSCAPWADRAELKALQREARAISARTGVRHVVDHKIPITHPRVCGLTVPLNMQIIHWRANAVKSNDWCPEQEELF